MGQGDTAETVIDPRLYRVISERLSSLGFGRGDCVFVHADMGASLLLRPFAGPPLRRGIVLASFHRALADVIGDGGTIAALAADYDYGTRHRPFIVEETPPDRSLGAYPRFLCATPGHWRSLNPIMSLVALGPKAEFIAGPVSAYGYGSLSPWQRLVDIGAKTLLWGIPPVTFTFAHHVEHMVGVPYKYNKLFRTPVYFRGQPIAFPVICSLRFRRYDIAYDPLRYAGVMAADGILRGGADATGFQAWHYDNQAFSSWLTARLAAEPFFLLRQPPNFIPGEIPTDDPLLTL